jgi:hypothetical protein
MNLRTPNAAYAVAIAIALLAPSVLASAQDAETLPPIVTPPPAPMAPHPFGQLRFGVLSIAPTFSLRDVGYDTNVFDLSGTERQPGDFTATLQPGAEVNLTTSRLSVRTLTHADFVYYQTYKSEQAFNPMLELNVDQRFSSHLGVYAKGNYGYAKARTGFEVDSRQRRHTQSTTVGVRTGGRKLRFDLHALYDTIAYDQNAKFLNVTLASTMNQTTTGGGVGVGYALSPYTTLTAGIDEQFHRFPLSPDRDMNTQATYVGVAFSPRAVVAGTAAIGYTRADPRSPLTPSFAGITPRAGLNYKLLDMLSLGVGAERGIENSFYGERPYYLFTLYEGSATLVVFHHFDVGGSLQYTTLDYRAFLDTGLTNRLTEFVRMETVNAGAPLKKWLRLGGFVQRWRRISDDRPYETTRIGMEMTVGPASVTSRGIFLTGPLR